MGAERIHVPLGSDWRKDLLKARIPLLIPPYSDSDSMVVGEEAPVEGGGEEWRDRSVDGEDKLSDRGGIGLGDGNGDTGSSVCSR